MTSFVERWPHMLKIEPFGDLDVCDLDHPRLRSALDVIDTAVMKTGASDKRRVPSAGAIYPYELLVLVPALKAGSGNDAAELERCESERCSLEVYTTDLTRRQCARVRLDASALDPVLAACDDGADFHIMVLTRPWLSVRKYGPRGYAYAQIDAAHVALNILGISLERGGAQLRTSLPRVQVARFTETFLPYRELHSLISVRSVAADSEALAWSEVLSGGGQVSRTQGDLEEYAWLQIPQDLLYGDDGQRPARVAPLLGSQDQSEPASQIRPHEWSSLMARRRSCKSFTRGTSHKFTVEPVLARLATALPTDLPDAPPVRVTVVCAPGVVGDDHRQTPAGASVVGTAAVLDHATVTRACMGQMHLANAAAFALVHAARGDYLVDGKPQLLRDAYFRAGAIGHLLYLSAAAEDVALTAIGGFDGAKWAALGDIPTGNEVLYVLALGSEEGSRVSKRDRLDLAYAHGE